MKDNKMIKRIILLLLTLLLIVTSQSQEISVASFNRIDRDMGARMAKVYDVNSELCALIKIETIETGFEFSGVVERTEQRIGEIWVFVSPGIRFLTIKHKDFGLLRNYQFPQNIESGVVYQMKLLTGGRLKINTIPEGATILIDGKKMEEKTPALIENLKVGEKYIVQLQKDDYACYTDTVKIDNHEIKNLLMELKYKYNRLVINSEPEGATILIDGLEIKEKTPITIEKIELGTHKVTLKKEGYETQTKDVTVKKEGINSEFFTMKEKLITLKIITDRDAKIYIDGAYIGYSPITKELPKGVYEIKAVYHDRYQNKDKERIKKLKLLYDEEIHFKLPVRKGVFVTADALYSFDTKIFMYGFSIGYIYKYVGLYAGIMTNFDFEGYTFNKGNNEFFYTGKTSQTWFASNLGLMVGKNKLYWKIGAEINYILDFWQLSDESWNRSKNYMFVDIATGFHIVIDTFVLSIDAIIPLEYDKRYWGVKLGAGINF